MTIIKPQVTEKKPDDEKPMAEVSTGYLPVKKEEEPDYAPAIALVQVRRRRRFNICVGILVLCILAIAAVGGGLLYRHLAHRNRYRGWCGTTFLEQSHFNEDDEVLPEALNSDDVTTPGLRDTVTRKPIKIEEEVEVDTDKQVETFRIPRVGPYRPIQVVYDFEKNLSAILDKEQRACFVKPLNRSLVRPPKSMLDFLWKLHNNYYLTRSKVSRQNYYIQYPEVKDVQKFGVFIYEMCHEVPTFQLRKIQPLPTPLPISDMSVRPDVNGSTEDSDSRSDEERRGRHGHGRHHGPGRRRKHGHRHGDRRHKRETTPTCYAVDNGNGVVEESCVV